MDTQTLGHFIGGEWTGADGALESRNPSNTDDVVARFPDGGAEEVGQAVAAASEAFPGWANASPEVRSDLLHKVGEKLFERSAEIGELLAREEGKTRAEGIGETLRAARIFRYFAGEALRRHGQTLESTRPGLEVATYREALGVVGLITPWNFPIAIPAWKAAPALAFGNTVVLKPANITPAIASALARIFDECGAPAGVFNMVLGRGGVGEPRNERPAWLILHVDEGNCGPLARERLDDAFADPAAATADDDALAGKAGIDRPFCHRLQNPLGQPVNSF